MYKLRDELIKSIMSSLKIDSNPFNAVTIEGMIKHIADKDLQDFYQKLFGAEHSFLNGIDRVAKVAETFKVVEVDKIEERAKEMILACETFNTMLFDYCHKSGDLFEPYVRNYPFDNITEESKAILSSVKPFYDYKELVIGIRTFQDSQVQLNAFKQAIKYLELGDDKVIANPTERLRIKKG